MEILTNFSTGLPTKNETSETIVRNVYWQFPYDHDTLGLKTLLLFLPNKTIQGHIQGRRITKKACSTPTARNSSGLLPEGYYERVSSKSLKDDI